MSVRPARRAWCPGCGRSIWITARGTYDEHTMAETGAMADWDCDWSGSEVTQRLPDPEWDEGL